eukprot:scaffold11206_cov117-Isochrysis_galbana.AAC.12
MIVARFLASIYTRSHRGSGRPSPWCVSLPPRALWRTHKLCPSKLRTHRGVAGVAVAVGWIRRAEVTIAIAISRVFVIVAAAAAGRAARAHATCRQVRGGWIQDGACIAYADIAIYDRMISLQLPLAPS